MQVVVFVLRKTFFVRLHGIFGYVGYFLAPIVLNPDWANGVCNFS